MATLGPATPVDPQQAFLSQLSDWSKKLRCTFTAEVLEGDHQMVTLRFYGEGDIITFFGVRERIIKDVEALQYSRWTAEQRAIYEDGEKLKAKINNYAAQFFCVPNTESVDDNGVVTIADPSKPFDAIPSMIYVDDEGESRIRLDTRFIQVEDFRTRGPIYKNQIGSLAGIPVIRDEHNDPPIFHFQERPRPFLNVNPADIPPAMKSHVPRPPKPRKTPGIKSYPPPAEKRKRQPRPDSALNQAVIADLILVAAIAVMIFYLAIELLRAIQ